MTTNTQINFSTEIISHIKHSNLLCYFITHHDKSNAGIPLPTWIDLSNGYVGEPEFSVSQVPIQEIDLYGIPYLKFSKDTKSGFVIKDLKFDVMVPTIQISFTIQNFDSNVNTLLNLETVYIALTKDKVLQVWSHDGYTSWILPLKENVWHTISLTLGKSHLILDNGIYVSEGIQNAPTLSDIERPVTARIGKGRTGGYANSFNLHSLLIYNRAVPLYEAKERVKSQMNAFRNVINTALRGNDLLSNSLGITSEIHESISNISVAMKPRVDAGDIDNVLAWFTSTSLVGKGKLKDISTWTNSAGIGHKIAFSPQRHKRPVLKKIACDTAQGQMLQFDYAKDGISSPLLSGLSNSPYTLYLCLHIDYLREDKTLIEIGRFKVKTKYDMSTKKADLYVIVNEGLVNQVGLRLDGVFEMSKTTNVFLRGNTDGIQINVEGTLFEIFDCLSDDNNETQIKVKLSGREDIFPLKDEAAELLLGEPTGGRLVYIDVRNQSYLPLLNQVEIPTNTYEPNFLLEMDGVVKICGSEGINWIQLAWYDKDLSDFEIDFILNWFQEAYSPVTDINPLDLGYAYLLSETGFILE